MIQAECIVRNNYIFKHGLNEGQANPELILSIDYNEVKPICLEKFFKKALFALCGRTHIQFLIPIRQLTTVCNSGQNI